MTEVSHVPEGYDFPPGRDLIIHPMYVCCEQCGAAVANHSVMTERHLQWHETNRLPSILQTAMEL